MWDIERFAYEFLLKFYDVIIDPEEKKNYVHSLIEVSIYMHFSHSYLFCTLKVLNTLIELIRVINLHMFQ